MSQLLGSPRCLCLLPSRAQTSVWPPGTTSTARAPIFSELPSAACRSQHWAHCAPTTLINPERVPFPVQPSVTFFQTPKNALGTSPTAEPYSPSPLPRLTLEPLGHAMLSSLFLLISSPCWSSGGLLSRHVLPPCILQIPLLLLAGMGSSPEDDGIIGGRFMQPLVTPDCTSALHRAALGTYFILVPCFGIKERKGSSVCA